MGQLLPQKIGAVWWNIQDDLGNTHSITLLNTYCSPNEKYKLLYPKHWAQKGNNHYPVHSGRWCTT